MGPLSASEPARLQKLTLAKQQAARLKKKAAGSKLLNDLHTFAASFCLPSVSSGQWIFQCPFLPQW